MNRCFKGWFTAFCAFALAVALPAGVRAAELRVCADPSYMPFSNAAGQGFENQLASFVARAMGTKLVNHWATTRGPGGFDYSSTIISTRGSATS